MGHEQLALDSPQESSNSMQMVRAVTVPFPDDDDLLVATIASSTAHTCFLCGKDHLLISCPLLSDIHKDDAFHRKVLLCALGNGGSTLKPTGDARQVCTVLDTSLPTPDPAPDPTSSGAVTDGVSDLTPDF